ncbi:hypothetical protein [Streptomyces sp. NPDC006193]
MLPTRGCSGDSPRAPHGLAFDRGVIVEGWGAVVAGALPGEDHGGSW